MIICFVVFRLCGLATRTRTQSVEHTCDVFQRQPSADGYGIVLLWTFSIVCGYEVFYTPTALFSRSFLKHDTFKLYSQKDDFQWK